MSYIFKPPAIAYDLPLTYDTALAYIEKGRTYTEHGWRTRAMGTTLSLVAYNTTDRPDPATDFVRVTLYTTTIARLYRDGLVVIASEINEHPRLATTWWVQKILNDNRVGGFVMRENGKYAVAGTAYSARDAQCKYCAKYAQQDVQPFTGTIGQVLVHAESHPIGSARDMLEVMPRD